MLIILHKKLIKLLKEKNRKNIEVKTRKNSKSWRNLPHRYFKKLCIVDPVECNLNIWVLVTFLQDLLYFEKIQIKLVFFLVIIIILI